MNLYQTCDENGYETSNWIETELDIDGIEKLFNAEVGDGDGERIYLFNECGVQVAWILDTNEYD